ncbi:hypothetical protein ACTHP3_05235 [Shouchella rhizosphaerae]|uniref:hypothetical protein n=1 Tax=Shouchella rhizosphaerae TaxID=866786 RepID=UPI003F7FC326
MDEGKNQEDRKSDEKIMTSEDTYNEIIINCFRYLGINSLYEAEILTLKEYQVRMKAYQLKRVDKEFEMHHQAWINNQVKATKEVGKKPVPIYKTFKEFYDYEAQVKEIHNPGSYKLSKRLRRLAKLATRANGKEGDDG